MCSQRVLNKSCSAKKISNCWIHICCIYCELCLVFFPTNTMYHRKIVLPHLHYNIIWKNRIYCFLVMLQYLFAYNTLCIHDNVFEIERSQYHSLHFGTWGFDWIFFVEMLEWTTFLWFVHIYYLQLDFILN